MEYSDTHLGAPVPRLAAVLHDAGQADALVAIRAGATVAVQSGQIRLARGIADPALATAIAAALGQWQDVTCKGCATAAALAKCGEGRCADRAVGFGFVNVGWQAAQPTGLGCAATTDGNCTYGPNGNQVSFVHATADWPFGSGVIAMTVLNAKSDTGWIADADIAVNDAGFQFCLDKCAGKQIHIGAVILHEAGHFIGLDHSADKTAILFAKPPPDMTSVGKLQPDDRAGACAAYPAEAAATVDCVAPVDAQAGGRAATPGCASAAAPVGPRSMLALLAAFAGWWRWRRWGRYRETP